jgi:hypothetical protein
VQTYIGCNWFNGVQWFNKERLETLLYWLFLTSAVAAAEHRPNDPRGILRELAIQHQRFTVCLNSADRAGFRLDRFLTLLSVIR